MSSENGNNILLLRVSVYQLQTFEWRFLPHWKNQNSGQFYEPFWIFRPFWRWLTLCVVPKVEFFCKTEKIEFRAMFIKLCASLGLSSDFFRNWHKSKKSVETEVYRFFTKGWWRNVWFSVLRICLSDWYCIRIIENFTDKGFVSFCKAGSGRKVYN